MVVNRITTMGARGGGGAGSGRGAGRQVGFSATEAKQLGIPASINKPQNFISYGQTADRYVHIGLQTFGGRHGYSIHEGDKVKEYTAKSTKSIGKAIKPYVDKGFKIEW